MNISVCVATYGDDTWPHIAATRAIPSAIAANPFEVLAEHQPDGTVSTARNAAAQAANGDWLCFLDADDELDPAYLDAMKSAYTGDDHVLLTPAVRTLRKGRAIKTPVFFDRGLSLRQDNWLIVGTLIHKDLFHDVGGFGEYPHGFEDWSLWSKAWRAGAEIIKVPEAVYVYHYNHQSKHKQGWRDRKWQVETHNRVAAELDAWEAART